MQDTLAFSLFSSLQSKEVVRFGKFLNSPYFNRRKDVLDLYSIFTHQSKKGTWDLEREKLWHLLFPDQKYERTALNYLLNFFAERLEQFLAFEEFLADHFQNHLLRCRAFRRRGLLGHFDANARELAQRHQAAPYRNAGWWLFEYQLQNEIFARQAARRRGGGTNLAQTTEALANFFLLENIRWAATSRAQASLSREAPAPIPLAEEALRLAADTPAALNPALALVHTGLQALNQPDDESCFLQLKELLQRHVGLFPPAEARDLYMTAVNFAIRRHNRGERRYTREAFDLYREALDKGILPENGLLPAYTFINILNLAQLLGEHEWSRRFLDEGRALLAPAERDNTHRYGLAGYHVRRSEYEPVLTLLREVEFSDVFIQLDSRKMLLRSYFELGEWPALASLLDSFHAFLRRQKGLGYHRDSYLNLIKFTQKLMKTIGKRPAVRKRLAAQIGAAVAVAEREWLLEKCG
ncbi:MAG: hypothetical protein IT260_08425 [Saprospiraceae bacterium]|nr:hypothetical protein [Saprospiraceae bacterium]